MAGQWLNYLLALENAILVMSSEVETLGFRDDWTPQQRTEGLRALQQIRRDWAQGKISKISLEYLERLSESEALSGNLRFRASLQAVKNWSSELLEDQSVCTPSRP